MPAMSTDAYLRWVYMEINGSREMRRPLHKDNEPSVQPLPPYHLWIGEEDFIKIYGRPAWIEAYYS